FDAMIATDLALAVCYPYAGNIGGGGFMVYRTQDGGVGTLDYRERAPEAAAKDMYLDEAGNVIPKLSTLGGLAIGVPGTVAGLFAVHEKFGTLPFEQLIQPAIDMAREGFVVTAMQAKAWAKLKAVFIAINCSETTYAKEYKSGDSFVNEPLAKTLEAIRDRG
ncbi:MAG: gamma-glutamyltransferase, partial [Flavobacteriales bacterium]